MEKTEAIYARQSLDKKESVSIETQIKMCKDISTGTTIEYFDKGYSGKNTSRPQLQQLISDIENDKIKKVIVYKLDRISRNITDFYNLYDIMQKHHCDFVSVSESFDTSNAMGRAMMGILAVFAQMERENIQLRVKDNYFYRIKDGRWAGGPAPFGFQNAKTEDGKPTLIVKKDEMDAVEIVFNKYAYDANTSYIKICRYLEENGYKSRRNNTHFDPATLSRMLQSPVYAKADAKLYKYYQIKGAQFSNDESDWTGNTSCHIVGKKPSNPNVRKYTSLNEQTIYLTNFPGVIDSRTFILVQERMAKNEALSRDNSPKNRLQELSGMLKCGKCGYAVKMKSRYPTLSCHGRSTVHVCDVSFKKIRLENILQAVAVEVQKYLNKMDKIQQKKHKQLIELDEQIKSLQKEIDNLITIAAKSDTLSEAVTNQIEQRQIKLHELELKKQMDVSTSDMLDFHIGYDVMTGLPLKIVYNDLDTEQKQAIVKLLIEKVLLNEDGSIKIIWKI